MRSFVHANPFLLLGMISLMVISLSWTGVAQEVVDAAQAILPPTFSVVAPFEGDSVSGNVVFIIKPDAPDSVTRAGVKMVSGNASFSGSLSASENWMTSWDASTVEPGPYGFEIVACTGDACATQNVSVKIEPPANTAGDVGTGEIPVDGGGSSSTSTGTGIEVSDIPVDGNPTPPVTHLFTPSNYAGAFSISPVGGLEVIAKSSGDPISLEEGSYDASLVFPDGFVDHIFLSDFKLHEDAQGASFLFGAVSHVLDINGFSYQPTDSVAIQFGVRAEKKKITLRPAQGEVLIWCQGWQRDASSCSSAQVLDKLLDNFTVETQDADIVLLYAKPLGVTNPEGGHLIQVIPANVPGFYTLTDRVGNSFTSEGEPMDILSGTYHAALRVRGYPVAGVSVSDAELDENATLLSLGDVPSPDENVKTLSLEWETPFHAGFFAVGDDYNVSRLEKCDQWNALTQSCTGTWTPTQDTTLIRGITGYRFYKNVVSPDTNNENQSPPPDLPFSERQALRDAIGKLKKIYSNRSFFSSDLSRSDSLVLSTLFSNMEISLECAPPLVKPGIVQSADAAAAIEPDLVPQNGGENPPTLSVNGDAGSADGGIPLPDATPEISTPAAPALDEDTFGSGWEDASPAVSKGPSTETLAMCDGVTLVHSLVEDSENDTPQIVTLGEGTPAVKQGLSIRNDNPFPVTRLVNVRLRTRAPEVQSDDKTISPSPMYQLVYPHEETETMRANADLNEHDSRTFLVNTKLRLLNQNALIAGQYDFSDYYTAQTSPVGLVHSRQGSNEGIVDTILTLHLDANSTTTIDPVFELSGVPNFDAAWDGNNSTDQIGNSIDVNSMVQLVDIDNNGYPNDLLIVSPFADWNGKVDAGMVYLIKDINTVSGIRGLANPNNYAVSWGGNIARDMIGSNIVTTAGSGPSVIVANVDGNAYANDLLINAAKADLNIARADNGAVYLIKDIDKKIGVLDLNNLNSFSAEWMGSVTTDEIGYSQQGGPSMQVLNTDGNVVANDLLIVSALTNFTATDSGSVYLIKDINTAIGVKDLNSTTSYSVRFDGNQVSSEWLGACFNSMPCVQVINSDKNIAANDILITSSSADCSAAATNCGRVYYVKDINTLSGNIQFTTTTAYTASWAGGGTTWQLGNTNGWGSGTQIYDMNGDGGQNDLILISYIGDANGRADNGIVYYIADINYKTGQFDLNSGVSTNYNARWYGGSATDNLGGYSTVQGTMARPMKSFVKVLNLDNNAGSNDLVMDAPLGDANGANAGAIYLVRDITKKLGNFDLNVPGSWTVMWAGATGEQLGLGLTPTGGFTLVNADNNQYANDLLVYSSLADINSKTDTGAVYLLRDINQPVAGSRFNLATPLLNPFGVRFSAGASEKMGDTNFATEAFYLLDADGNGYTNDLVIPVEQADMNNIIDNGAVYLIRDIDKKTGGFDLNSGLSPTNTVGYDAVWYGASPSDLITDTNRGGPGVQIVNVDGGAAANDMMISAPKYDTHKHNAGAVFLVKNLDNWRGNYQLDNNTNFTHEWRGDANDDGIGDVNTSALGVFLGNTDGNANTNDLIIVAAHKDVNNLFDNGAVYLVKDIDQNKRAAGFLTYNQDDPGADGNSYVINNAFKVNVHVMCKIADCGDTQTSLQFCQGYNCANFNDINNTSGGLRLTTGSSPVGAEALTQDSSYDINLTVTGVDANTYMLRWSTTGTTSVLSYPPTPYRYLIIEPSNSRDLFQNYNYFGRYSGGIASDKLGYNDVSGQGVQIVNVDNGSYSNDLLVAAPNADINGKVDNGAVYLFRNVDLNQGTFDLNLNNYTARWDGGTGSDFIGDMNRNGLGIKLVNVDGNSYSNDLIIGAPMADAGVINNGAVYLIKDIDFDSGSYDFNVPGSYSAVFRGASKGEQLGNTDAGDSSIQVVNLDGNVASNDMLIGAAFADANGKPDAGRLYIVKDINTVSGIRDFNTITNFTAALNGAQASDELTASSPTGVTQNDAGYQLVNVDNNVTSNDLLIKAVVADTNSKTDPGILYLIEDVNTLSGVYDFNNTSFFDLAINGGIASDQLGYNNGSGAAIQLVNIDGNAYSNDLLVTAVNADAPRVNGGAVFLFRDIDKKTPARLDMNMPSNYTVSWRGGATTDTLGDTGGSGAGVQVVNLDGNASANDLFITNPLKDFNGKTDVGGVMMIKDINTLLGFKDFNNATNYNAYWYGQTNSDQVGDVEQAVSTSQLGYDSGPGVQIVNIDNNSVTNDMLLAGPMMDINGKADAGAIFLVKDVDRKSGQFNLTAQSSSSAAFIGAAASGFLGDTNKSGDGVELANVDANAYSNDLIISSPRADTNGRTDNGAIYLIKDADKVANFRDLSQLSFSHVRWFGATSSDFLGDSGGGMESVQIVNLDGGTANNDMIFEAAYASLSQKTQNGVFYLDRNIDELSGTYDLLNPASFDRRYLGGRNFNSLGATLLGGEGVQLGNIDGDTYSNDLIVTAVQADVNSKTDTGGVYYLNDVTSNGIVDKTFVLSLPSSGCTVGNGNITGGTACQKGYIESTDTFGASTATQISPEGQSASQPFFQFDNQSTSASDFNILLDLNEAYPAAYKLKAGNLSTNYESTCSGNPGTGCILLSATPTSVGKATYSAGTQDLNVFFWGDFTAATVGQVDRNVDSNSTAS